MSDVPQPKSRFGDAVILGAAVWSSLVVIVVVIVCWRQWSDLGLSLAVVMGSGVVGASVGFVFGVPRAPARGDDASSGALALSDGGRMVANTNLSRVSDWLTTIVVGLGIAQFGKILHGLGWLGGRFAAIYTLPRITGAGESAYGLFQVLAGVLLGFILMFMWTSTRYLDVLRGTEPSKPRPEP